MKLKEKSKIKYVAYDSETIMVPKGDKIEHKFYVGDFWDGGSHYTTMNPDSVIAKLKEFAKGKTKTVVIIHNSPYDLAVLDYGRIQREFKELEGFSFSFDRPAFLFAGNLQILDTYNFLRASLKALETSFLGKKSEEKERNAYILLKQGKWDEWNQYIKEFGPKLVREDTEALLKIWSIFVKETGFDKPYVSAPQLAYHMALREVTHEANFFLASRKYRQYRIEVNSHEGIMNAFRGGRTEALRVTKFSKKLNDFDINSLYPTVMGLFDYPLKKVNKPFLDRDYLYVQRIKFKCPELDYIPVVLNKEVLTQYREGEGWFNSVEIEELERFCEVERTHDYVMFEKYPLFHDFVGKWYKLKMEYDKTKKEAHKKGDVELERKAEIMRTYVKLVMNSSYGKFGQHKERRISLDQVFEGEVLDIAKSLLKDQERQVIEVGGRKVFVSNYGSIQTIRQELEPIFYVPIASFVTSYARTYLYEIARMNYRNLYYTDTDSFFLDSDLRGDMEDLTLGSFPVVDNPYFEDFKDLGIVEGGPIQTESPLLGKVKKEKEGWYMILSKKQYYEAEPEDWRPRGYLPVSERIVMKEGTDIAKTLTWKGLPKDSYRIEVHAGDTPFDIKVYSYSYSIRNRLSGIQSLNLKKVLSVIQRLKYRDEGDYYLGEPL